MRLYLLDAEFPGDQHIYQVGQLPLQKLPLLKQDWQTYVKRSFVTQWEGYKPFSVLQPPPHIIS